MKLTRIFIATAVAMPWMVAAQDINTEITIEREVVPEQRAALRPDVLPRLQLPQVEQVNLTMAERADVASVPPYMWRLEPARFAPEAVAEQRRGYVSGGYLPVYNLDLSAGYRLMQTDRTWADVFGQFNGKHYNHLNRNSFMAGAALNAAAGDDGRLRGMVDFRHSRFNRYDELDFFAYSTIYPESGIREKGAEIDSRFSALNLTVGYEGKAGETVDLSAGVRVNMADYKTQVPFAVTERTDEWNSNRQWRTGFDAGLNWHYNELSSWGLDFGLNYIMPDFKYTENVEDRCCYKQLSFRVTPHYTYKSATLAARLGVSVSRQTIVTKDQACASCEARLADPGMSNRTLVAPDLHVTWRPSGSFAIWGDWTGRGEDNFLGTLYDAMPYMSLVEAGGFSTIPVDIKAGINLGPWRGASLQIRANYANAESWIMPMGYDAYWVTTDLSSLLMGAEFRYDYRSLLSLDVAYDRVMNDESYYMWRDGAKAQFKASVTVRPIKALDLQLSYLSRNGRHAMSTHEVPYDETGQVILKSGDYGSISSLDFGAKYRVNSRLGLFVSLENILGKQWELVGGVAAQKLHGLVGATYTF